MVMEAVGMSWDVRMFNKWSVHGACMDHGRYKSPANHVDSLGHPLSKKINNLRKCLMINVLELKYLYTAYIS